MLIAAFNGQPFPAKRVKHEASTLDFEDRVAVGFEEVREHFRETLGYSMEHRPSITDVSETLNRWAAAPVARSR